MTSLSGQFLAWCCQISYEIIYINWTFWMTVGFSVTAVIKTFPPIYAEIQGQCKMITSYIKCTWSDTKGSLLTTTKIDFIFFYFLFTRPFVMVRAVSHNSASCKLIHLLTLKSLVHIYSRKKSTWKISPVSTVHNVWTIHQAAVITFPCSLKTPSKP